MFTLFDSKLNFQMYQSYTQNSINSAWLHPVANFKRIRIKRIERLLIFVILHFSSLIACSGTIHNFNVLAFYTAKNDAAHISFVNEANTWFAGMAGEYGFTYRATDNWELLNEETLSAYQVVIFLDTRTEDPMQRIAFENYMKNGGAWMGFHFSAFTLTSSDFPNDWEWYHNRFLGCGEYVSNTWRPTSATLRVEDSNHPATSRLPSTIKSSPNEWYRWEKDLRNNPDIDILLSIDTVSFPLGTGPKPNEIWHSGYYPVVWTNHKYRMIYINMGHNDIDYENKTNKELSHTFINSDQNTLILDALLWLGGKKQTPVSSGEL